MRPMRLGLLAALIFVVMAPAAMAQRLPPSGGGSNSAAANGKAPTVDSGARKQGMADAPAIVQAAGIDCQVSDARFAGQGPKDPKTGVQPKVYEVACGPGSIGFMLQTNGTAAPNLFSCLVVNYPADGKPNPNNACILPTNYDMTAAIAALAQKAKMPCTPTQLRGIGQTPTNTLVEAMCANGAGYIITGSVPLSTAKDAQAMNCLGYDAANVNVKCALGSPQTRITLADAFGAKATPPCAVKDRRYLGLLTDGTEGYEYACSDGKGVIVKVNTQGAVTETLNCANVAPGSCTLTDSRAATAEQAGLYTKLAKAAGSNCEVSRYAVFPQKGDKEVVELVCGDGAGAIGMFPATGKGTVYDCGHALLAGYRCSLGKPDYTALTNDLKKFDKKDCTVSEIATPKKAEDGTFRLEVACADGLPGYVINYTDPTTPKEAVACNFAGTCTLPTNKKKG